MRRIVLLVPVILLAAACTSGRPVPTVDGSVPHGNPAASPSASPSPSITFLPDDVMQSLSTLSSDVKKIVHDGDNSTTEAADCGKIGADASAAGVQTIPNPAWQQQWSKTMSELQKAANECSTGQSTGDIPTLQQGLTDVTAANEDLQTFLKMTG
ncbi:hypothetical protein ACFC8N_46405 [Streptomyces sp. NPDC055966]|uniref:hypothetical protein n=1 Tax=Streptomyces sp. NPDC055966 TaxID=3345669 RepID=UPI0035DBB085